MKKHKIHTFCHLMAISLYAFFFVGCATHQGYQGASIGALTGSTAGALIDDSNPWRGAAIGGGLGAILGGALTDRPQYATPNYGVPYSQPSSQHYGYGASHNQPGNYPQQQYVYPQSYAPRYQPAHSYTTKNHTARGATVGGVTGATAGALIDSSNPWRGGLIGGFLGSIFGGSIGAINSHPSIPVLHP